MPPKAHERVPRAVLRDVAFLRLWVGTTASGLATWALPFVLGLAVLDRSLSPAALGLILATRTAGFLVAVPLGGVLADRYSRRAVIGWAGLSAAVATLLIAVGVGRSVLLMACAAAVFGAGNGACRPAFQALVADVVEPARRQQANAAITLAVRVTVLMGPGLASVLAAVVGTRTLIVGSGRCGSSPHWRQSRRLAPRPVAASRVAWCCSPSSATVCARPDGTHGSSPAGRVDRGDLRGLLDHGRGVAAGQPRPLRQRDRARVRGDRVHRRSVGRGAAHRTLASAQPGMGRARGSGLLRVRAAELDVPRARRCGRGRLCGCRPGHRGVQRAVVYRDST